MSNKIVQWMKKCKKGKHFKELENFHNTTEKVYDIVSRIPGIGDTTVPYPIDEILNIYNEADAYTLDVLKSGVAIDARNKDFLSQDFELRGLMIKALLVEMRNRNRNARVSIREEILAKKRDEELALIEVEKKYEEMLTNEKGN